MLHNIRYLYGIRPIVEGRNITPEDVPNPRYIMTGEEKSTPVDDLKGVISGKPPEPKDT